MATIRKAIIPIAGHGTRHFPATAIIKKELFPIIDGNGCTKPLIQIIAKEAVTAGVEQLALVVQPGDDVLFRQYFESEILPKYLRESSSAQKMLSDIRELGRRITYIDQPSQEGFGHAVYCAKDWAGKEPFLLLLGDHVYVSYTNVPCARQLVAIYATYNTTVSAVTRTPASMLYAFGTVGGKRKSENSRVLRVAKIKEKPALGYAKLHLRVADLPEDEYLCFFGQHIFSPSIFDALKYQIDNNIRYNGEIQLTSAQELMLRAEGNYLAYETAGERFDTGEPKAYAKTLHRYYRAVREGGPPE